MPPSDTSTGGVASCPVGCEAKTRLLFDLRGHRVTRCPDCGVYALEQAADPSESILDRSEFDGALQTLRLANYARILGRLQQLTPLKGRRLLDVGCSTGWFLDLANQAGCLCHGIEPDGFFYGRLRATMPAQVRLVQGAFSRDLPPDWGPFDIISFHDVFEHLPEPGRILERCREQLVRGGYLVLSLPVADGFAFRVGRVLYRLGVATALARMFQINYPYPHLYYFTRRSIRLLAERSGFDVVWIEPLRAFSVRGSLHRARMDRALGGFGLLKRYAGAGALLTFALLEPLVPADNVLVILCSKAG